MTTKLEPHCASKRRTRDKLAFTIPSTASVEMESEVAWEFNLQDAPPPQKRGNARRREWGSFLEAWPQDRWDPCCSNLAGLYKANKRADHLRVRENVSAGSRSLALPDDMVPVQLGSNKRVKSQPGSPSGAFLRPGEHHSI